METPFHQGNALSAGVLQEFRKLRFKLVKNWQNTFIKRKTHNTFYGVKHQ